MFPTFYSLLSIFCFFCYNKNMKNIALEWSKEIIWYQIFPDRFRRGNPDNPIKETYFSKEKIKYWAPSRFSKKWETRDHWEKNLSKDFYSTLHLRRYLGDIKGIKESIPYLKKLGITGIYLNPIFMAPSSHKYDHACLHHIDPYLGSDPLGDIQIINSEKRPEDPNNWKNTTADIEFFDLVRSLHKNNIRIIIDGVFNHSGRDFFAFQDILKKGKDSSYKEWYDIHDFNKLKYNCWLGHSSLPEFSRAQDNLKDVVKDYIFACIEKWLFPDEKQAGGDGIRLDAADCLPHGFLKDLFSFIKNISSEKLIVGELWHISSDYVNNKEMDIVMNYPFAYNAFEFFIDRIKPSEFIRKTEELFSSYPKENLFSMQNLFGSHDSSRLSTIIKNPGIKWRESEHFQMSQKYNNPKYNTNGLTKTEKRIRKNMLVMQFTFPGAPMVYYGDEVGLDGANDPDCRKPMLWDDILSDCKIDFKLRGFYKRLISKRNKYSALRNGTFKFISHSDNEKILVYIREDKKNKIVVAFNNSSVKRKIKIFTKKTTFKDVLKNKQFEYKHILLQPYSSVIIEVLK
ncbi:hypothetical protein C0585_03925 [Candidatus Woesearchaeota archaeon]|nr:MAG: hypothetical protein C0585_03925 [Candidatus Woesearchaeota archaeon]